MSVDLTHYLGIGVKLSDDPDFDKFDAIEEKYPQYSQYEFIRKGAEIKSNIRLIVDGMNGDYAYLMYVINEVEQEDMYGSKATSEFPFNSIESADVISELQTVYSLFNDGKELRASDVNIISLFHCS
jgi:hypothetical protein